MQLIRIDGATPAAERTRLVAAFQQSPGVRVALLSVTAAGQGLTLTAASTVIFAVRRASATARARESLTPSRLATDVARARRRRRSR